MGWPNGMKENSDTAPSIAVGYRRGQIIRVLYPITHCSPRCLEPDHLLPSKRRSNTEHRYLQYVDLLMTYSNYHTIPPGAGGIVWCPIRGRFDEKVTQAV